MSAPEITPALTRDEIAAISADLMNAKKRIEDEWAQGKRTMLRANLLGLWEDLGRMVSALDADDANAFRVAADEARNHASSLNFHSLAWLKQVRS